MEFSYHLGSYFLGYLSTSLYKSTLPHLVFKISLWNRHYSSPFTDKKTEAKRCYFSKEIIYK